MPVRRLTFIEYVRSITALLVFYLLLMVVMVLIPVIAVLTFGKATNWMVKTFAPILGKPVLFFLGIDFEVEDLRPEPHRPAVYLFNHSSTLDIPTLLALALERIRIVIKWEMQYIIPIWAVGRMTGQIFIKRQDRERSVATLQQALARLKTKKLSLVMAPEGSRKHSGKIGPFKKGAFHMALDLGYPVIPVYFEGNDELSYRGSLMAKSGKLKATIHPPVDTSGWKRENIDEHIAEVRAMYLAWAGVKE